VNPLTRRRLLQASGASALALAGGSALLMWGSSDHYRRLLPPGAQPRYLSEKELAVLATFCDRVLPSGEGHLSPREARIAERIDRELTFHTAKVASDFKSALFLVEHGGWAHARPTRFTRLAAAEQDAALAQMAEGGDLERQAFNGLRIVASFFYYCDDRSWKQIHYEGPLVTTRSPPEADSRG
jgi:hypothetical protein